MPSVNRVILVGNLTRDPQLRFLPSQMAVVDFGLAMNRKFKTATGEDREEVCFVDCSAFGKTAETINKYCQKGKLLYVEGRLKLDEWEDKNGGGKRSKLKVTVENFQFLGGRDGGGAGGGGTGGGGAAPDEMDPGDDQSSPAPSRQAPRGAPPRGNQPQPPRAAQEPPLDEGQQFKEDDIPF
jgi:single-strand DNA-binding protein